MNIGMLWYDNDVKSDLAVKIERAMSYYREKYRSDPVVFSTEHGAQFNDPVPIAVQSGEPGDFGDQHQAHLAQADSSH